MPTQREAAVRRLEALITESEQLRASIEANELVLLRAMPALRDHDVSVLMADGHAGPIRRTLTEAITRFEACHHRAMLSLVAVGTDEGVSLGRLSRVWGVSRQLMSRYAKELRGTD